MYASRQNDTVSGRGLFGSRSPHHCRRSQKVFQRRSSSKTRAMRALASWHAWHVLDRATSAGTSSSRRISAMMSSLNRGSNRTNPAAVSSQSRV
eukprot:1479577-Prymnesium_polylepis.2